MEKHTLLAHSHPLVYHWLSLLDARIESAFGFRFSVSEVMQRRMKTQNWKLKTGYGTIATMQKIILDVEAAW
jgi:hypothetical protein